MVNRVNNVAAEFRKVSNKQMAETTKRTIRENVSIQAQLQKMSDKTMELIKENDEQKAHAKRQKQQIEMLETNEKELIKKNHSNQKVGMNVILMSVCQSNSYYVKFSIISNFKNKDQSKDNNINFMHQMPISVIYVFSDHND
jgi:hypothetical protein